MISEYNQDKAGKMPLIISCLILRVDDQSYLQFKQHYPVIEIYTYKAQGECI
jgi:hypothetical protein